MKKLLFVFCICLVCCFLFSCRVNDKCYLDFLDGDIIGSNRDGYARKIDADFFINLRYDSIVSIYYMAWAQRDKYIGYSIDSIDNTLICEGYYQSYGKNEKYIYLYEPDINQITIIEKLTKKYNIILLSEFNDFDIVNWNKI